MLPQLSLARIGSTLLFLNQYKEESITSLTRTKQNLLTPGTGMGHFPVTQIAMWKRVDTGKWVPLGKRKRPLSNVSCKERREESGSPD